MKKISLLLCLALVTLVANAASQYDTKDKVINRAKAIAARHVIHHNGGEFMDVKEATNAKSVDALEKLIKNDSDKKFEKICDEIENYKVNGKDTASLIKSFEALLKKYNVKDKNALEQVRMPIRNSSPLFINESISNSDEQNEAEHNDDELEHNENVPQEDHDGTESYGKVYDSSEDFSYADKDELKKTDRFSSLLPTVLLSLALLASLFFCFQLWRKNKELKKERSKIRENLRKITDRVNSNYANKDTLVELAGKMNAVFNTLINKEIGPLEEKIKELEEKVYKAKRESYANNNPYSISNNESGLGDVGSYEAKDEESLSPTVTWDITKDNSGRSIYEQETPKASLVGKEMYLYLPNDNMFKEGSEEYRPGKTLYKMVYTSEEAADFEFVNKPEALAFAKQSRSRFLESACFIENDDAISFNTIQTLEKGKLVKADEGWNIISKARIHLS